MKIASSIPAFIILVSSIAFSISAPADEEPSPFAYSAPAPFGPYPLLIKSGDADRIKELGGDISLAMVDLNPNWGALAQIVGETGNKATIHKLQQAGIPIVSYMEGLGSTDGYVFAVRRLDSGGVEMSASNPTLPKIVANVWGWNNLLKLSDQKNLEFGWTGIQSYTDPLPWEQPFSRAVLDPEVPSPTFPDGTSALRTPNDEGEPADFYRPSHYPVYSALCVKDIFGHITWSWTVLKKLDVAAFQSLPGAVKILAPVPGDPVPPSVDDPAPPSVVSTEPYPPVSARFSGSRSTGLDPAAPFWLPYMKAQIRRSQAAGSSGVWFDNFSIWDNLGQMPLRVAFGSWSVAGFKTWLPAQSGGTALANSEAWQEGKGDIRTYLLQQAQAWAGQPVQALNSPVWVDPRWDRDGCWQAFKIYKRDTCRDYLTQVRAAASGIAPAAKRGLVIGNDDCYDMGVIHRNLDMGSEELSLNRWTLIAGNHGFFEPPYGTLAPVYKAMRQGTLFRTVSPWLYGYDRRGVANLDRVIYYEALAHEASPAQPGKALQKDYGTAEVSEEFNAYARVVRDELKMMIPYEPVGLVYSSDTLLAGMRPGGLPDFANQSHASDQTFSPPRHLISHWGWGESLLRRHIPYQVVANWDLTPDRLSKLKVLVLPSLALLSDEAATAIDAWVKQGGVLVAAGITGTQYDASRLYQFRSGPLAATALSNLTQLNSPTRVEMGAESYIADDPGLASFSTTKDQEDKRVDLAKKIEGDILAAARTAQLPDEQLRPLHAPASYLADSGSTVFRDPSGNRAALILFNKNIQPGTDALPPLPETDITVRTSGLLSGEVGNLQGYLLSGKDKIPLQIKFDPAQKNATIHLPAIPYCGLIVLEKSSS